MDDRIIALETRDVRFPLPEGAGSDTVHSGSDYAFATTLLVTQGKTFGTGIVLTLGNGVCREIEMLAQEVIGLSRAILATIHQLAGSGTEMTK